MDIEVHKLKAFSDSPAGGNAAGVVMSDLPNSVVKQLIASKVGYSETAFVSKEAGSDYHIEFFTPTKEIDICGHATVASIGYMQAHGLINKKEISIRSKAGVNKVFLQDNYVFLEQNKPVFSSVVDSDILPSLGLHDQQIPEHPIIGNTGVSFLLIEVPDQWTLKNLRPDFALIEKVSQVHSLVGFYVFTTETNEADATTRMFAPAYGIDEESATGMAAGPLVCHLFQNKRLVKKRYLVHQGHFMDNPSPSDIYGELYSNEEIINNIRIGGKIYEMPSATVSI